MKVPKITILLLVVSLISIAGCQNSSKKLSPSLSTIGLLRGDLQLCNTEQFGEVGFAQSCSYQTRENFNIAMSLLHSFEYVEAEKLFVRILDQDPECAMAYWGVAMCNFHPLWADRKSVV